jgi:hypothetical protein
MMNKKAAFPSQSLRSVLLGLGGLIILIFLLVVAFSRMIPASFLQPTASTPTAMVTPSMAVTQSTMMPTEDVIATKQALENMMGQTRTAAAQTPVNMLPTLPPTLTPGPTETPNYTLSDHQFAGDGIIVFESSLGTPNYPIVVYDFWVDIPRGNKVFAGGTTISQGAITVEANNAPIDQPEVYLTPRQSGRVKIVDAQGQRLVLRTLDGNDVFYFDIPTRQFVDSLTTTVVAPTVTLWATYTPIPTMVRVPTYTPTSVNPPANTPTAIGYPPPPPNPTASAIPAQGTGTAQP